MLQLGQHYTLYASAYSVLEGEEVLHLPVIVEAAESSPAAAREAANRIRKFLSKENFQRAYVQYNAIMLVRILADNPGKSFTKNLDTKFVITVKELLRDGRDMSVQQILRETLETFETQKANDETLTPLREMWSKEKLKLKKRGSPVNDPPEALVVQELMCTPAAGTTNYKRTAVQSRSITTELCARTELFCAESPTFWHTTTSRASPTNRGSKNICQIVAPSRAIYATK